MADGENSFYKLCRCVENHILRMLRVEIEESVGRNGFVKPFSPHFVSTVDYRCVQKFNGVIIFLDFGGELYQWIERINLI